MSSEKLQILKMIEEGKITAAEGAKLLEAVGTPPTPGSIPTPNAPQPNAQSQSTSGSYTQSQPNYQVPPSSSTPNVTASIDRLAKEVGRRLGTMAKDFEPTFQKITETVAEKTVLVADKISHSLSSSQTGPTSQPITPPPMPPSRPAPAPYTAPTPPPVPPTPSAPPRATAAPAAVGNRIDRNIDIIVPTTSNELSISCLNGPMVIKGYNGDKISARLTYKPKRNNATIDFLNHGNRYFLHYNEDEFDYVAMDVFLPEGLFDIVKLGNTNGNMDISGVRARNAMLSDTNGELSIKSFSSENMKVECSNGKLIVNGIRAANCHLEDFNGQMEITDADAEKLDIVNFNGGVMMNISSFSQYNDYSWCIETGNGKLAMNIPASFTTGYAVKANTSLGSLRVSLADLVYTMNTPRIIDAKTANFDTAVKKVRLALETSNGPITVN